MSSDLRTHVQAEVGKLLPEGWDWVSTMRPVDVVNAPTVTYKLLELEPLPEAPLGNLRARVVLTVITPLADPEKAELQVDDLVLSLILGLDGHSDLSWETARKVKDDRVDRLAWDITVTAVVSKPIPPATEPAPVDPALTTTTEE